MKGGRRKVKNGAKILPKIATSKEETTLLCLTNGKLVKITRLLYYYL